MAYRPASQYIYGEFGSQRRPSSVKSRPHALLALCSFQPPRPTPAHTSITWWHTPTTSKS